MPMPKGIEITIEKIWSKNAGRTAGAKMVGDIIAFKTKLKITWPMLSRERVAAIDAAITPAFFNVTFTDPRSNSRKTQSFYAGTPTYAVYSYAKGLKTYNGVGVDLIEQ